jgi:hypothetical protein
MVLVVEGGSVRTPIQKIDLRAFFREVNCATRKSSPTPFQHYMRRAAGASGPLAAAHQLELKTLWGSFGWGLDTVGLNWVTLVWPGRPFAALQLPIAYPFPRGRHKFWYHTCKPCYPGSGWRRQLCPACLPGAWWLLGAWMGGRKPIYWSGAVGVAPIFATDTRSPAHYHERAPYGVCG